MIQSWLTSRLLSIVVSLIVALTLMGSVSADGNVTHERFTDTEVSDMPLDAGFCGIPYPTIITENRTYDIDILSFVSGPKAGQFKVNGFVDATFTIAPAGDQSLPTYTGSYREKDIVLLQGEDEDELHGSFILIAEATGSDGSALRFVLHGHMVTDASGDIQLEFEKLVCARPVR